MDQRLLAGLVCPSCLGQLQYDAAKQQLICEQDQLAYPIRDNIPVLLESEAMPLAASQENQECHSPS